MIGISEDVIDLLPQIRPEGLAVFCYLVMLAGDRYECCPSYDMITEATGLSRGTVAKALSAIIAAGLAKPRRRFSKSTSYTISPHNGLAILFNKSLLNTNKEFTSPTNGLMEMQPEGEVGEFCIWMDVFCEITHIPETHIKPDVAAKAIEEMKTAGATVDDMRAAYLDVKDGYTIVSPRSLVRPTINAMRKRLSGNRQEGRRDMLGV